MILLISFAGLRQYVSNSIGYKSDTLSTWGNRWFNDGDLIGVGYGKKTCNAAARFLIKHGNKEIQTLINTLWGLDDYVAYGKILDQLVGKVVDFIEENPDLRIISNEDMFSYFDETVDIDDE